MIFNEEIAAQTAEFLLQIKAIKLEPSTPFIWSSGWKSPIYCDNRITLSYPPIRTFIRQQLVKAIEESFEKPHTIAGVATSGIALGALVAQEMGLPFVYLSPEHQKEELHNQIQGHLTAISDVLVLGDLISTGKSALTVVDALRSEGCTVKYIASIFEYGLSETASLFKEAKVQVTSLCDYNTLINKALELEYIQESHIETLLAWQKSPATWE